MNGAWWEKDYLIFQDLRRRLIVIFHHQFEIILFIKIVLATILIFLTGYLFTRFLMRKGLKLNFLEMIGTAYLLGFGIIPFIPLVFSSLSIELQWLFLFIPILIIDVVLISLTFPKNINLDVLRRVLYDFGRKLVEKKDILFFFVIIYAIILSLVMLSVFRGVPLGVKWDSAIYAHDAELILHGTPFYLVSTLYTPFYLLILVSVTVLTGTKNVYNVSSLFAPLFSISGVPLVAFVLINKFTKNLKIIKLGTFLLVFVSEELMFWSLFGKGHIVGIAYIILSLNFFIRSFRKNGNRGDLSAQEDYISHFEVLLSGFLAGVAFLYHTSAGILISMIAFFLVIEGFVSRHKIRRIIRPVGLFFPISLLLTSMFWIPSLLLRSTVDWKLPPRQEWYMYIFVEAGPLQRILYPFLFYYVPRRQIPPPLPFANVLFGFGTGILFMFALIFIIFDRGLIQMIEKRLVCSCLIFAYLFPFHPILSGGAFYFLPNRFVIYLDVFSVLIITISLSNNQYFRRANKRYPFVFKIIWLIILIFTVRWYVFAMWQ